MRKTWFCAVVALTIWAGAASAQLTLSNPNWNITLTDAGYSDLLLDNTPGFEGREYLSGEWGAAVAYTVGSGAGARHVSPTWLEKNFIFPDWQTNSNFTIVNPITGTETDPSGLLTTKAISTLENSDLKLDLSFEMIDTVFGMKLGTSPKSAAAGSSVDSNRYVLKQTYTLTNTTSEPISGINFFQFLHALEGVASLYDNRDYAGPLGQYRYDTTQLSVSSAGTSVLRDYLSFGSKVAPVAFDNGRYGVEGVDDHVLGKPSEGVHLAIETDALANQDNFAPAVAPIRWVGGAQKYSLGNLAPGNSISIDVLLSVRTGTEVQNTGACDGSANGGSSVPGGVDFSIANVIEQGAFFGEYSICDASEMAEHIANGDFTAPGFFVPGRLQLFELEFDGVMETGSEGGVTLTFGYDPSVLPEGYDETLLAIWHFDDGEWAQLESTVDPLAHTITGWTPHLSQFAVGGAVPEPTTCLLVTLGALHLLRRRRR